MEEYIQTRCTSRSRTLLSHWLLRYLHILSWSLEQCKPGGVHSNEVWVEVWRRGLETPTLFKTKIFHFATLFKTRSYSLNLTRLVYPTDFSNFPTKIIGKKSCWCHKSRLLISSPDTLLKDSCSKRHVTVFKTLYSEIVHPF